MTRVLAHSGPQALPHAPRFLRLSECLGWTCQEGMPLSAGHRGIQNSPTQKREVGPGGSKSLRALSEHSCLFIYLIRGLGHQSPFLPVPREDAIRPRVMPQPPAVAQCVTGYLKCASECSLTRQNSREAWEE